MRSPLKQSIFVFYTECSRLSYSEQVLRDSRHKICGCKAARLPVDAWFRSRKRMLSGPWLTDWNYLFSSFLPWLFLLFTFITFISPISSLFQPLLPTLAYPSPPLLFCCPGFRSWNPGSRLASPSKQEAAKFQRPSRSVSLRSSRSFHRWDRYH